MRKLLLLSCFFMSHSLLADESLWADINSEQQFRTAEDKFLAQSQKSRRLKLDILQLKEMLTSVKPDTSNAKYLDLPLPDGKTMRFKAEPSRVMAEALAERYPEILTWKISNPSNPAINGRIDLSPNGFHGLINTDYGERIFIDPEGDTALNQYTSRYTSSQESKTDFNCQVHNHSPLTPLKRPSFESALRTLSTPADPIRTYKIAIATTGEYTQLFGGRKSDSLAAVVTTVNRLNQVFERDLSINLELVANNDDLLYTSPSSDPYSNEDAVAMVEENIVNINAIIGTDHYDIGHVFGTGNTGGLAFLSSACGPYKAGGVTGSNTPAGESFNIDYVAHEIGHQLGASHTFNGTQLNCSAGNRTLETAVEPGSGSSIMGYAGICSTDDLQSTSDAFFHSASINQIKSFSQFSTGSSCGSISNQDNDNPSVFAGTDYTIPAETPFLLTGTTSDPNADLMLHSWEQIDTGSAGGLFTDLGDNPLFRTWPPVSDTTRYLPRLVDILNETTTIGETLPTTDRPMNFTLLTRDNKGGVAQDEMEVSVINTGSPFSVLSQSNDTTLSANQAISVQWDTANTAQAPISCASVNIGLIDNFGTTTPLLIDTLNDGAESLIIPADIVSIQDAHIQVSCANNIFFAVSKGKINILGGYPVLSASSPSILEEDSGVKYLTFHLFLSSNTTENIAVNYTITDSASSAIVKSGTIVINRGTNSSSIQVPVAGDTLDEGDQILHLSVTKPLNAQFADAADVLVSVGTIIDDDIAPSAVAASPEINPSNDSSGGGGTFNLLSIFGMLLLSALRKKKIRIK